jgi:regulator of sigma E protease
MPPTPRVVEAVAPRSPAASAGLMKGDIILDFDKQDYSKENQYRAAEKVTALLVYRKGAKPDKFGIEIGPDKARIGQDIGLILQPVNQRMGVISAIKVGSWRTVYIIVQTGVAIKMMVNREMTAEGLAGPVGIIQYASTFARSGIQEFIFFFAAISVTLAIVNLIPFPALDGSLIAFFLWEGITKRPMDPKKQGMIIYVGFCILIGLIILLTIRDARLWLGM